MAKSLGLESAARDIRVNALGPGYLSTQKVIASSDGFADLVGKGRDDEAPPLQAHCSP
jgi:NAD(P)-dependent dehydrogenase (short-subunit alcohol dehydrogenase family)